MPPITDSHVHFWNPDQLRYAWLEGIEPLRVPFLPADYDHASAGVEVAGFVFVQANCEAHQAVTEARWVAALDERVQAMAQLRHHVTKLVKVPVFDTWTGYLWQAGHAAMLVRSTRSQGGLDVLAVTLDVDAWTRLITGGLATNTISLPPTA